MDYFKIGDKVRLKSEKTVMTITGAHKPTKKYICSWLDEMGHSQTDKFPPEALKAVENDEA